jgi:hypothetical protein
MRLVFEIGQPERFFAPVGQVVRIIIHQKASPFTGRYAHPVIGKALIGLVRIFKRLPCVILGTFCSSIFCSSAGAHADFMRCHCSFTRLTK